MPTVAVVRGCALGALLSLMSGCKPERAPFVDGARQSAGGATDESSSTDSGGDGTLQNGGPGTPGGNMPSLLPRDVFDPEKIYLEGETTRLQFGAFAPLTEPNSYILGFSTGSTGGVGLFWGNQLIYHGAGGVFQFQPDPDRAERKENDKPLEDNDPEFPTGPCRVSPDGAATDAVRDVMTGPEGRVLYTCYNASNTWYESGSVAYSGPVFLHALGYDGFVLTTAGASYGVLNLSDGKNTDITGLPNKVFTVRATRAHTDGFHLALQMLEGSYVELYSVDAASATATKVGNYPTATGNVEARAVLGPDDVYYRIDHDSGEPVTVRSLTLGDTEPVTVFTQTDASKLVPSLLITGP